MHYMLLSISGQDRPGIVRDVSESLLHINANIEDSSMTALRGRFAMMLIVDVLSSSGIGELKAAMAELEQRTGLTVQSQTISKEEVQHMPKEPDCVITVSGADQPGIVHAVSDVLASLDVSIVDVSTQSRSSEQGGMYMMALEAVAAEHLAEMHVALAAAASKLSVEIQVHELESGIL
ncbi:MAG: ACT domain-containing protein [Mariprofundaceae bacterium]